MYEKLTQNMEFSRVKILVFFRGDNLVDEKFTGIVRVCHENFRRAPTTFISGDPLPV